MTWRREAGRHLAFNAVLPSGVRFHVWVIHGGGWGAMEYGPRGGVRAAEQFWIPPDRAGQARAWCEARVNAKAKRRTS